MDVPNAAVIVRALKVAIAVAETIRDLGEVPSGQVYAQVCGEMPIQVYEDIIAILKKAGLVSERGHLLKWVGPAKVPNAALN